MGVFAITQAIALLERQGEVLREAIFLIKARHPTTDGRVVGGCFSEGLAGQTSTSLLTELTLLFDLFQYGAVVGGITHDRDAIVILGGAPDHAGSTDVDFLDQLIKLRIGVLQGLLKGVQV